VVGAGARARAEVNPNHAEIETAAQRHYARAGGLIGNQLFAEALVELQAAQSLAPEPAYLFLMGQCHEALGHKTRAVASYRAYLGAAPQGANARDAAARITAIETGVEPSLKSRPNGALAPVRSADAPSPRDSQRFDEPPGLFRADPPTTPPSPVYTRWWFWAGAAMVLIGAGAATYALAR